MTPGTTHIPNFIGMKRMQVRVLGTAESTIASSAGCIEIMIVAFET
jgi:hypothetical protein